MDSAMDERQVGKYKWRYICQSLITLALLAVGVHGVAELWLDYDVALPLLVSSVVFLTIGGHPDLVACDK